MRWSPAPDDLVAQADRTRWTTDNPAPAIVGYLVAWRTLRDGGTWTIRTLAAHLGWSRWAAGAMLDRVTAERRTWEARHGVAGTYKRGPDKTSQQPDTSRTPAGHLQLVMPGSCGPGPDSRRTVAGQSPDDIRARLSTGTTTTTPSCLDTSGSPGPAPAAHALGPPAGSSPLPVAKVWAKVNAIRAQHLPGCRPLKLTPARRRHLKARMADHGPEAVPKVWGWALTSSSSRARFLREQGYVRPDTLHRAAKFPDYLEQAEADLRQPSTRPQSAGADLDAFLADD